MKPTVPLLIATLALLLAACEKPIYLPLGQSESQVVVMAQGVANQPFAAKLNMSLPVFGSHSANGVSFPAVTDATVSIWLTGNGDTYTASSVSSDGIYTFAYVPQTGDSINLQIEVPGRPAITASASVPAAPSLGELEVSVSDSDSIYGTNQAIIDFRLPIVDNGATHDFYSIRIFRQNTWYLTHYNTDSTIDRRDTMKMDYYTPFDVEDPLLVENSDLEYVIGDGMNTFYGDEFLFRDERINGVRHTLNITDRVDYDIWNSPGWDIYHDYRFDAELTVSYRIEVSSLSRDQYLYLTSVQAAGDDPFEQLFSEPVQIHSNVKGGIGIFGIRNTTVINYNYNEPSTYSR